MNSVYEKIKNKCKSLSVSQIFYVSLSAGAVVGIIWMFLVL
jgi:hypothetical protein